MLEAVEFLAGMLIVLLVMFDLFQTVVLPRPTPITFRPSGRMVAVLFTISRRLALSLPKQREQLLGMFAPYSAVALLLFWGTGLALGYGLLFEALKVEMHPSMQLGTAFYFSAVSLLTLGLAMWSPSGASPACYRCSKPQRVSASSRSQSPSYLRCSASFNGAKSWSLP